MPTLEELEHRVARLESLFEEVIKERLNLIAQRLDQVYEKTEGNTAEIEVVKERLNSMAQRLDQLYEKSERDKTEILTKTEKDKREIIFWVAGLLLGFSTLLITAMWALLSFAVKP